MQEENNVPPDIKDITLDSNDTISQIFDKILKRILLALSKPSVTAFINGMFSESFPLDSEITYHYTENVDGNLAIPNASNNFLGTHRGNARRGCSGIRFWRKRKIRLSR